jgi:hypothetical protein
MTSGYDSTLFRFVATVTLPCCEHLTAHIAPAAELVGLDRSTPSPLCVTVRVPFDPAAHTVRASPNAEPLIILINVLPAIVEHRACRTDLNCQPVRLRITALRVKQMRFAFARSPFCPPSHCHSSPVRLFCSRAICTAALIHNSL